MNIERCPFCGGEARIETCNDNGAFRVSCYRIYECGATQYWYDFEAEAIAAWNRRAEPENEPDSEFGPVSEAEIERLRNKKTGYICTVCCFPMEESLEFCPACKAQGTIKEVI